jgi:hypothetical protein
MANVNSSMNWNDFWRIEEGPPNRLVLHIGRKNERVPRSGHPGGKPLLQAQ